MPQAQARSPRSISSRSARAVDVRFALDAQTLPHVADICRRLDGIKLALELAAARINFLPVPALARKLADHFQILRGDRTALPRHQTMRALIDWSFDLLEPLEARMFELLAIFTGGCTAAEAAAVFGGDEYEALALLASLVDKSLVAADPVAAPSSRRARSSSRCSSARTSGFEWRAHMVAAIGLLNFARPAEAGPHLVAAMETARRSANLRLLAVALEGLAAVSAARGEHAAARIRRTEALEVYTAMGAQRFGSLAAINVADAELGRATSSAARSSCSRR